MSETPWNYPFDEDELWDLKYVLAEYIVIRLEAFCQKWKDGAMWAIPVWVAPEKDLPEEEYKTIWITMLETMIYGFNGVLDYHRKGLNDYYDELDQRKMEEGLALFGKYFEHLWD
ncbi:MAG: hypothetical protein U0264_08420 [Candidatus Kapaibacterium sp.]